MRLEDSTICVPNPDVWAHYWQYLLIFVKRRAGVTFVQFMRSMACVIEAKVER